MYRRNLQEIDRLEEELQTKRLTNSLLKRVSEGADICLTTLSAVSKTQHSNSELTHGLERARQLIQKIEKLTKERQSQLLKARIRRQTERRSFMFNEILNPS